MTRLACLPMYDWPEERARVDALWQEMRRRMGTDPVLPAALTRPADDAALLALWRNPALILGQTCWGPLSLGLLPGLTVLAQPDYSDVPGGDGPFYRSALLARAGSKDTPAPAPAPEAGQGGALPDGLLSSKCLAFNARHSLSGWLALARDLGSDPAAAAESVLETGSHRAAIRAVAAGRADIAAVDCRTWALAQQHEPCARALVVIGWTAARPGLPFVTGAATDAPTVARLREVLIGMGCHPPARENP
ncbi:MAG: phosphate/phosphite/phosphonate ABC transporter substrate-binding protein [Pararhodobacter sp.]